MIDSTLLRDEGAELSKPVNKLFFKLTEVKFGEKGLCTQFISPSAIGSTYCCRIFFGLVTVYKRHKTANKDAVCVMRAEKEVTCVLETAQNLGNAQLLRLFETLSSKSWK